MNILTQSKLIRSEWESIESPVSEPEKKILALIRGGYENVNIVFNDTTTMIHYAKLQPTEDIHFYLYEKYFKPLIEPYIKQNIFESFFSVFHPSGKAIKNMKKTDIIRLQNVDQHIQNGKNQVFEFIGIELCKTILKGILKNQSYESALYTLIQWNKMTILEINTFVKEYFEIVINIGKSHISIRSVIQRATQIIEKNDALYKYDDLVLFAHQKQLFTFCRLYKEKPKLLLYTAPTGTGKTLSPIGLSEGYKIIFLCVARHVGLALAKSAISIGKRVAFAFGCETASDIRLHYLSAVDYEVNRKTGGIWKVDNSNGRNVEIMICDVESYLCAMYYMASFNDPTTILTYWDEPTITLDYEEHPLHKTIHENWQKNIIPNMVLACATLPHQNEIAPCIQDFQIHFPNAFVHTITSFDCRKSISIINKDGFCFLPHIQSKAIQELQTYSSFSKQNKTILRYFDLDGVIQFILFMNDSIPDLPERYTLNGYFEDIEDITMNKIKTYYLELVDQLNEASYIKVQRYLQSTQQPKYTLEKSLPLSRLKSVDIYSPTVTSSSIKRNNSDSIVDHSVDMESFKGILLTTRDAYTLTDGPTIYLADGILNLAKFYVQQSKIPDNLLKVLYDGIKKNDQLQVSIQQLEDLLEKQLLTKNNTDNKEEPSKTHLKEGKSDASILLKDNIQQLRNQMIHLSLHPEYVPNQAPHQLKWSPDKQLKPNVFSATLEEKTVKQIMEMDIATSYKILVLMGIGVLVQQSNKEYEEIVKRLAEEQKLYLILTSSDYIYGTNYQFCHGFIGKDLQNMTPQKTLQAMGRIGRTKAQGEYTVRFRDDQMIKNLFQPPKVNVEAYNMNRLFCHD